MKTLYFGSVLAVGVLFTVNSCSSVDQFAVTTGDLIRNFSCQIDGTQWYAEGPQSEAFHNPSYDATMLLHGSGTNTTAVIRASRSTGDVGTLTLVFKNVTGTGAFKLVAEDTASDKTQFVDGNGTVFRLVADDAALVQLTQLDTSEFPTDTSIHPPSALQRDVIGTFEVNVMSATGVIKHFTTGKFDLYYSQVARAP